MANLKLPKYLYTRTGGADARYWCRFTHPVYGIEEKRPTRIPVSDVRRAQEFSNALHRFITDKSWHNPRRKLEAVAIDPIAAEIFYKSIAENSKALLDQAAERALFVTLPPTGDGDFEETLPHDSAVAQLYEQLKGERHLRTDAEDKYASLQATIINLNEEIRSLRQRVGVVVCDKTFDEAVTEYLEWGRAGGGRLGRPWSPVHARQQDARLTWWAENLQRSARSAITLSKVEQAVAKITGAAKTKSDYVMVLRGFLTWARKHSYLFGDPLANLAKLGKEAETDWRSLTLDEIRRLLIHAAPERKLFYEFAVSTGMRVGEILALTWSQIDFENQCIRAKAHDTKSRKKATQPLPLALMEKLKSLVGLPDAPILKLPPNYNRGWRDDLAAACIPYETPAGLAVVHSLRKSYTTLLQELAGASLSEAQKLARHSTPALTSNVYTKTAGAKLLALVDNLGERLLA